MKKVSVIGAGSWGSALAVLLANNGHEVTLWTHDPHEIEMLSTKREQVEKLPGVKLPDNIMIEADLKTALTDEDRAYLEAYRQSLRNMPETAGFPFIDFPAFPTALAYELGQKVEARERMKQGGF